MVVTIEDFMRNYSLIGEGNDAVENATNKQVKFVALSEPEDGMIQIIDPETYKKNSPFII